jgi:hypothetical protein
MMVEDPKRGNSNLAWKGQRMVRKTAIVDLFSSNEGQIFASRVDGALAVVNKVRTYVK